MRVMAAMNAPIPQHLLGMKGFVSESNVSLFLAGEAFFHAAPSRDPSLSHPNCRGLGFFPCSVSAVVVFCPLQLLFRCVLPLPFSLSQFRSVLLCTVRLLGFSMSDSLIWVSAQLPRPFQPNVYVQMWWQETSTQVRKGPAFPSAWECHVQYPGCSLCRHAPRVSRHKACGPSSTRSCEFQARQPGVEFFI